MDSIDVELWTLILEFVGAFGTIASVLFAVHTYRSEQTITALMEVKKSFWKIPVICNEINELLSEKVFSALGDSIGGEFKKLHEERQSLDEFSEFLLDEKSQNYKAQAIYAGLKYCDEVAKLDDLIREFEEIERTVSVYYPCLGLVLKKLFFYIEKASKRTMDPAIFNKCVQPHTFTKAINYALETKSRELYFRELSEYFSEVAEGSLRQTAHGQRTIDLSIHMVTKTCEFLSGLELKRMAKIMRRDKRLSKKATYIHEKHAVEDAMIILKQYRKYFNESVWEKMIEWKAGIIENMNMK